jgi:hypothetical protein
MVVAGLRRIGDFTARRQQAGRVFGEVERFLLGLVDAHTHFSGVGMVVAAHAEDAVHREECIGACHCGQGLFFGREQKLFRH